MDTSQYQKRSGIPISKSPGSKLRLSRAFSKSNDDGLNDNPPITDLDMFTMLEENISLKDSKEQLIKKNTEILQKNIEMDRENLKLSKELTVLSKQYVELKDQLQKTIDKLKIELNETQTMRNIQDQQKKMINNLMTKIREQESKHIQLIEASKHAKTQLEDLVPSSLDTDTKDIKEKENNANYVKNDNFAVETMEQLVNDIGSIRTHLNNTELQLYEANEKVAELIEHQHQLEKENTNLKVENTNLTNVAMLMTNSMKESVDTSKKMEVALIKMKKQNNELTKENKDALDSPISPKFITNDEVVLQLKDELNKKDIEHSERIVEMCKLMETTIKTNYNDEIHVLQLKLEMVEKELNVALERADKADAELVQLKKQSQSNRNRHCRCCTNDDNNLNNYNTSPLLSSCSTSTTVRSTCEIFLDNNKAHDSSLTHTQPKAFVPPPPPPPPPPPMPKFNLPPINIHNQKDGSSGSLYDGIAAGLSSSSVLLRDRGGKGNQQVQATGMDALIAQMRDGSVTLRRNRRKSKANPALQEMFDVLEISRKQNRNSNMLIDSDVQIGFVQDEQF